MIADRISALSFVVIGLLVSMPAAARAACNLIPAAEKTFPSTLGSVNSPVTAPGKLVSVKLRPVCDAVSLGFDTGTLANNIVTLTFSPPGGGVTEVPVSVAAVPDSFTLRFNMPDTSGPSLPHGLAGPATIRVEHAVTTELLAHIGPLFQPTDGCDREPETVFHRFTVLPKANLVADLVSGASTQILATLDGDDNLLVPLNYLGVLPLGPSAPVARLLDARSGIEAFAGTGSPMVVPDKSFVRSFTLDGRPLPPLLRVNDAGNELFGTADAAESVIRIARNDGAGGGDIYDFTDRLLDGRGPIVIDKVADGFTVTSREAIPLEGLQSSLETVVFARDESLEGDLNADADTNDAVVQVLSVSTGAGTNTGKAALSIATDAFQAPEIVTDGDIVAFLESEAAQGIDYTTDGDFDDAVVRVYRADGTELSAGLDVEVLTRRLVNERTLAVSGSFVFFKTPDVDLGFVGSLVGIPFGVTPVAGGPEAPLPGANRLAFSPDGLNLYASGGARDSLAVLRRDPTSGLVEPLQVAVDGVDGVVALDNSEGVVVSPDGEHVYVASNRDDAIAIFGRDPATGGLVFAGAETSGAGCGFCLDAPVQLDISPDGAHLYVAAENSWGVNVFTRSPATGLLTFVEEKLQGVGGVDGIEGAFGVTVSPDGAHVYVTGLDGDSIGVFSRDGTTGELTFVQAVFDGVGGVDGLDAANDIAISPDGLHAYVASGANAATGDDAVAVFSRDPITGILTFVEVERQGVGGVDGMEDAGSVVVSPDGSQVYVSSDSSVGTPAAATVRFTRDATTGELTFAEKREVGCDRGEVAVSPDGANVYVGCELVSSLHVFEFPGGRLRVFDTVAQALRPNADSQAGIVAVNDEQAAFLGPDPAGGGPCCDFAGRAVRVYDATSDLLSDLDGTGTTVASSSQLVAVTVHESEPQSGGPPQDFNLDGDELDEILGVIPAGSTTREMTTLVAENLAVSGTTVAFLTREASEGGANLNGDLDATDRVVRLFEYTTNTVTTFGMQAEEFILRGDILAFRTSEEAQGDTDLNGDGDKLDTIMRVYQLSTGTLFDTKQAAEVCDIPGCDPFLPYKVRGNNVSFITKEAAQGGADLNGDGDGDDTVMQVFNVVSGKRQVFDLGDECQDTSTVTRFPEALIDGAILFIEQSENELGQDLNGDGDTDDCVTVVTGDNDDDGTFNDDDTCVEDPNPGQDDIDGDALGDVCDPAFSCSRLPLAGCRTPFLEFKSQLTVKDKERSKQDKLSWKWLKGEATGVEEFGDPLSTDSHVLCMYDESSGVPELSFETQAPTGGDCAGAPCWKATGSKGFVYRDKDLTPTGVFKLVLKSGFDGKAKAILAAKGENLSPLPPLPLALPTRVQLQNPTGACWEAGFKTTGIKKSTSERFKGKAESLPPPIATNP